MNSGIMKLNPVWDGGGGGMFGAACYGATNAWYFGL